MFPMQTTKPNVVFLPNLQNRRIFVESENRWVSLRLSNAGLRVIDKVASTPYWSICALVAKKSN